MTESNMQKMQSPYTPTTEEVCNAYGIVRNSYKIRRFDQEFDRGFMSEFDRWLAEVKAQAWEQGYAQGSADNYGSSSDAQYVDNPYRKET